MSEGRPLRIAFAAYRGNMNCGGQGIYLWFLARELARLGHRVDVLRRAALAGADALRRARRASSPTSSSGASGSCSDRRRLLPRPNPAARASSRSSFYELAASRIGFLPEPFAFSVRAFRALAARLRAGQRFDLVHDVQCLGYGLLGVRALGLPVVTTIHHPLSVDRRASFARDRSLREALGTMEFYPVGMQAFVARRLDRDDHLLGGEPAPDRARLPRRPARLAHGRQRPRHRAVPARSGRAAARRERSSASAAPRTRTRACARWCARSAASRRALRLTLVDEDSPAQRRAAAGPASSAAPTASTSPGASRRRARRALPARDAGGGAVALRGLRPAGGRGDGLRHAGGRDRAARCPRWWRTGGGGILVPPEDPEALAKAIATLRGAARGARATRRAARPARIEAAYAWPRVAARTVEVYAETLAERARPAAEHDHVGVARAAGARAQSRARSARPAAAAGSRSTVRVQRRQAPGERDADDALELEAALRLLAHQVEVVAREVIGRHVVVAPPAAAPRGPASPRAGRRRLRAARQASDSKFAIASTTRPRGRATRAISAIASSGRSKWSMAPLQSTASKLAVGEGQRVAPAAHPERRAARAPSRSAAAPSRSCAPRARRRPPARRGRRGRASPGRSRSRRRAPARPGPGAARARVASVMRSNRNSLSRVVPVGITSAMSRSRSTTRTARDLSRPGNDRRRRSGAAPRRSRRALRRRARGARACGSLHATRRRDRERHGEAGQRELALDALPGGRVGGRELEAEPLRTRGPGSGRAASHRPP